MLNKAALFALPAAAMAFGHAMPLASTPALARAAHCRAAAPSLRMTVGDVTSETDLDAAIATAGLCLLLCDRHACHAQVLPSQCLAASYSEGDDRREVIATRVISRCLSVVKRSRRNAVDEVVPTCRPLEAGIWMRKLGFPLRIHKQRSDAGARLYALVRSRAHARVHTQATTNSW